MENKEPKNQPAEIDVPTALSALAQEVVKLDRRTVELAEANSVQTQIITALVDAQERIMANHGRAFGRIAELLAGLGCDVQGPELIELRKLFDMPSPTDGDKGPEQN